MQFGPPCTSPLSGACYGLRSQTFGRGGQPHRTLQQYVLSVGFSRQIPGERVGAATAAVLNREILSTTVDRITETTNRHLQIALGLAVARAPRCAGHVAGRSKVSQWRRYREPGAVYPVGSR